MITIQPAKMKLEDRVKLLEEELNYTRNKLTKLSVAVEQSSNSIIITNTKGEIEFVNRTFIEKTGYSFDEVIGKNPRLLKSNYHNHSFYENLWEEISNGNTWRGEFMNKRKDGHYFWEHATITPIKDEKGQIVSYLAIKEDISSLMRNQEELEMIFNHSPACILLIDQKFVLRKTNCSEAKNFKNSFADLVCVDENSVLPGFREDRNHKKCKFDISCHQCPIQTIISNTLKDQKKYQDYEIALPVQSNGEIKEGNFLISSVHIKKKEEGMALLSIVDMTKQVQNQKKLEANEKKLRHIINTSPDAILIYNSSDFEILEYNKSFRKLTGFRGKEINGRKITDDIFWQNQIEKENLFQKIQKKSYCNNFKLKIKRKSGEYRSVLISAEGFILNGHSNVLLIIRDITEIQEVNIRLLESEEKLKTVVANTPSNTFIVDSEGNLILGEGYGLLADKEKRANINIFEDLKNYPDIIKNISDSLKGKIKREVVENQNQYFEYHFAPYYNSKHEISGIVCTSIDVTERIRAKKALRESIDNLKRAQKVAHIGNWNYDFDKDDITRSEEANKIYELQHNKSCSLKNLWELIHPDDKSFVYNEWQKAVHNPPYKYDVEHRIVCDNKEKWVKEVAEIEFSPTNKPIKAIGITYDITERKNNEILITQKEKFQQLIFNNLPIGLGVFDTKGELLQVNLTLKEILDFIFSKNDGRINGITNEYFRMTGLSFVLNEALDGKHISNFESHIYFNREFDSTDLSIDTKWLNITTFPIYESEGKMNAVVLLIEDISLRKLAENKLLKSEEKFSKAFDLSPDMMLIFREKDLKIIEANKAILETMGFSREEIIGSVFDPHLFNISQRKIKYFTNRYKKNKGVIRGETKISSKTGEIVYVDLATTGIVIDDEQYVMVNLRNITEKKKANKIIQKNQQQMIRLNKEIAEYKMMALRSAMNPHFIFNTLNSIQYYISLRERQLAIKYLSVFSKLVRNILNSSINRYSTLEKEIEILESYIQLEKLRFEKKFEYQIIVDDEIEPEYITIPSLIVQPFVENAIIHGLMNKKGSGNLKINFNEQENGILCIVEDNGIGREAAKQFSNNMKKKYPSVGVSLTKSRLEIVNIRDKVSINYIDLKDNKNALGTRVEIFIEC